MSFAYQASSPCRRKRFADLGLIYVDIPTREVPTGSILGRPKSLFRFFHKIKDTFFIFTNNFIDLDILSMSTVSCYWLLVGQGQGFC